MNGFITFVSQAVSTIASALEAHWREDRILENSLELEVSI